MIETANNPSLSLPASGSHPAAKRGNRGVLLACVLAVLATLALWGSRQAEVSFLDFTIAAIFIAAPCVLCQRILQRGENTENEAAAPIFLFVTLIFAINFAVALFWSPRKMGLADNGEYSVGPELVTQSMLMAMLAFGAIYCGVRSRVGALMVTRNVLDLKPGPQSMTYVRVLLVLGGIFAYFEKYALIMGSGGRQFILALQLDVPTLAFALLYREYLRGRSARIDRWLLVLFALNRVVAGISSGWLGALVIFSLVLLAVYLTERRKIPWAGVAVIVAYVIFMQPGKEAYRKNFWYNAEAKAASPVERIGFWVTASIDRWGEALDGRNGTTVGDVLGKTAGRTSLVTVTAHILDYTPAIVPYQYGSTFSYLFISIIPRAVWPNKPSANEATRWYQVNYRLSNPEDLDGVALAPGLVGEAYLNWGWSGVVFIFVPLGIFLDFLQRQLGERTRGVLFNALGVVMLHYVVLIEAQMSTYLSAIVQSTVLVLLAYAPVLTLRPAGEQVEAPTPAQPLAPTAAASQA